MNVFFVIILVLICSGLTAVITYFVVKEKFREKLYKTISNGEQGNARMLAAQYPETLQVYLDNLRFQERNLTELEYLTFNYYKNSTAAKKQQLERQKNQKG